MLDEHYNYEYIYGTCSLLRPLSFTQSFYMLFFFLYCTFLSILKMVQDRNANDIIINFAWKSIHESAYVHHSSASKGFCIKMFSIFMSRVSLPPGRNNLSFRLVVGINYYQNVWETRISGLLRTNKPGNGDKKIISEEGKF